MCRMPRGDGFRAVPPNGFTPQDVISKDVIVGDGGGAVAVHFFKAYKDLFKGPDAQSKTHFQYQYTEERNNCINGSDAKSKSTSEVHVIQSWFGYYSHARLMLMVIGIVAVLILAVVSWPFTGSTASVDEL